MPSTLDVYSSLYVGACERAWQLLRRARWTLLVPVVILAATAVLERFVTPLHELAHWGVAFLKALLWSVAFWVLTRLVLGARTEWAEAKEAALRRVDELPALAWGALSGTLVFVALEVGGGFGVSVLCIASTTPVLEYVLFDGCDVGDAARRAWDFSLDRLASWVVPQVVLLTALSVAWAMTVGVASLLLSAMLGDTFVVFADLAGAVLFGPVVMFVLVLRGLLFFELRRLTHRQRMFQARL